MPQKIPSLVPVDEGVDPNSPFFDPELDPSIYLGPCTQGHEEKFTKARGICKYFARGTCRVMSSCRFLHAKIGFHYDGQAFYRCYKQTKSHPFPCHQLNNEGQRTTNRGFGYHMYLPEGIFENGIWTPLREADGSANARGLEIVRQYRPDYIPRPRPLAKAPKNAEAPHQTASLFRQPQLDTGLPVTQPWPTALPSGDPSSWQQHVHVGRGNQAAPSHGPYTHQPRMIQPLVQEPVPRSTAPASGAFDLRHDPAIIAIGAAEPSPPPSRPTSGDLFPKARSAIRAGGPTRVQTSTGRHILRTEFRPPTLGLHL